jgi:hypothetical protein
VVNVSGPPVLSSDDPVDDEVWHDEGNPMASAACSNSCWNGDEARLEKIPVAVIFGCGRIDRFAAHKTKWRASNEAPGTWNKMRRRSRARSLVRRQRFKLAAVLETFWRGIAVDWRRFSGKEGGEKKRRTRGRGRAS